MRKFGICRDFTKVSQNISQYTLMIFFNLPPNNQGACQNDAENCKYKHRSPADLGIGNDKTTWEDVRAREEALTMGHRGDRGRMDGGEWEDRGRGRRGPSGPSPWMGSGPSRGGWDGPDDGWDRGMDEGRGGKRMRMDHDMGAGGDLRHENQRLMAENEELRRKVQELTVTNKFLLDLNAEMRLGGGGGGGGGSSVGSGGDNPGYSTGGPGYGGGAVFSTGDGR